MRLGRDSAARNYKEPTTMLACSSYLEIPFVTLKGSASFSYDPQTAKTFHSVSKAEYCLLHVSKEHDLSGTEKKPNPKTIHSKQQQKK